MVTFENLVTTGFFLVGSPESIQRTGFLWKTVVTAVNRARRVLPLVLLLTISAAVARAQSISAGDPASPIQDISLSDFNQLIQSRQLTVTDPSALNHAVVENFIQDHPNLPGFAQFVETAPTGPDVVPTPDGNYMVQVPTTLGTLHAVETMGQESIVAQIAQSLLAASDPVQQFAHYQSLYAQYTALYDQLCTTVNMPPSGCANLPFPSQLTTPPALQDASLGVIKTALLSLGMLGNEIVKIVPSLPSSGLASCSADIGNNTSLPDDAFYGDQSLSRDNKTGKLRDSSSCAIPSPVGILANFSWPNKNMLTCVKEQGTRDSCHIFGATSALEEMIAIDTGNHVNLSEQDFMEHEKGIWNSDFFHGDGNPMNDLLDAAKHGYKFAYEDQWDYNPSYEKVFGGSPPDANACKNYPTSEPGCSDSAPQEPELCFVVGTSEVCPGIFTPAILSGARSPYGVNAAAVSSIWDPSADQATKNGYVGQIKLNLLSDAAVILAIKVTHKFTHPTNGYITYDSSDTKNALSLKGGHVIHIVGFIDNTALASNSGTKGQPPGAGGGYFIIKNSYGYCTGDAGYEYMPVQYLEDTATGVFVLSSITD